MTGYKLAIPGVTTAETITRTPAALEAKKHRQELLKEIRRRAKSYKKIPRSLQAIRTNLTS